MIEITKNVQSVLHDISEKVHGEGWAYTHRLTDHTDKFGNQHKHLGVRFVSYRESFLGFIRRFGSEEYFPLMVFQAEPIPDEKWDGDLEIFYSWAKQRGLTVNELMALADVFNGRTENNPNPLVDVLKYRVTNILSSATESGYYRKPSPEFFLEA